MSSKNLIGLIILAVVVVIPFQNCGQNMTPVGSSSFGSAGSATTSSLEPCVAAGCPQSTSYIQLEVSNNNPISFLASGTSVVEQTIDVAGYCNAGGYPSAKFYYSIQDLAGNIVVPTSVTSGSCDVLGKFHFPVNISMLSGSVNYELNVTLRGVDSTGVEFDNSLGLNKRQVGISPRTGI